MKAKLMAFLVGSTLTAFFAVESHAQEGSGTKAKTSSVATDSTPVDTTKQAIKLFKQAKAEYRSGNYLGALENFKKAYELKPTPAILYNVARCYEKLSKVQEAIKTYEQYVAQTTDPRDKAETLEKIESLRRKDANDPDSPDAQYKVNIANGKSAFRKGDYEGAIAAFKAAYDIKPTSGALFNIAKSYERMGRFEEAVEYLQQYLEVDPNATDRANIEENIRRLKRSIRDRFQELSVSSDPPGADIYLDDRTTGLQGQTNYRMKVKPGPHTIYLDLNGYEPYQTDFVMPDDKPLALEFKLKKLTNVGFAEFKINVDGARIFVDGAIVGLSPFTQPKALPAGKHQLTIEASGFPRYTQAFVVNRGKTSNIDVTLKEYVEPIKDETLSKLGRSFFMIGLFGGGLGFGGPWLYQEYLRKRPLYENVGPAADEVSSTNFYTGPNGTGNRTNSEAKLLTQIQFWSGIGGGVFMATGMTFFMIKWFRPEEKVDLVADIGPEEESNFANVEVTGLGLIPTAQGAAFGMSGSF
ncbi:MAG: PEGA domain-containing protein [Myxococcota bacterium]|nr:PEGA domain-containing protein [Myxococcota bacterium]